MRLRVNWKPGKSTKGWGKELAGLDGRLVQAGVTGPHAHLARVHEFGCRVPVTPKMRAYLHHRGVHLRRETKVLVIPERAFLRRGYDALRQSLGERAAGVLERAAGGGPAKLEELGRALAEGLRAHAKAGAPPPKKAFPGASGGPALTDTGAMLDGIDYEIK